MPTEATTDTLHEGCFASTDIAGYKDKMFATHPLILAYNVVVSKSGAKERTFVVRAIA